MRDSYINYNKIKENKYKILRMSIILASGENQEETLANFEESAREIDAMNDETYLTEIEDKFYDTVKLEEEEEKLAVLVDYIGGRVEQRISLLSDFANITGYDLTNLPPIKYYDKLDDYKERLKYIREYLSNTEQINKLTEEIEDSEKELKEAYVNKATNEEYNGRNEDIILGKFKTLVKPLEIFKGITDENIDAAINEVISNVEESKKSLDIFQKSYTTLRGSGISFEEETEYKSYVDNAKYLYYENKEQEYLLRMYKILQTKETEYEKIIVKRSNLNDLLYERLELRKELEITSPDVLASLYDLLERQYKDIEQQKNNIEAIDYLSQLIETSTSAKNELDQDNQKVEILSLLREFCIIDTFAGLDTEIETTPVEEEVVENETTEEVTEVSDDFFEKENTSTFFPENTEEIVIPSDIFSSNTTEEEKVETKEEQQEMEPVLEEVKDNQVINVEDATNLDIALIQSKAGKVMRRVGEMLGIKTEETKIVSVTNEDEKKEEITPLPQEEVKIETPKQEETNINNNAFPEMNPLFENNNNETQDENPLFGNVNNVTFPEANPLFQNTETTTTSTSPDPEDDNNFWFPSDTPDALNELPDLELPNNNFFGNGEMPNLNFPDLKLDFGPNNEEGK